MHRSCLVFSSSRSHRIATHTKSLCSIKIMERSSELGVNLAQQWVAAVGFCICFWFDRTIAQPRHARLKLDQTHSLTFCAALPARFLGLYWLLHPAIGRAVLCCTQLNKHTGDCISSTTTYKLSIV